MARSVHKSLLRFLGAFPSPPMTDSFFLFLRFFAVVIGVAVVILFAGEAGRETSTPVSPRVRRVVGAAFLFDPPSVPGSLSDTSSNGSKSFGLEPNGVAPVGMNRCLRRCSGWT